MKLLIKNIFSIPIFATGLISYFFSGKNYKIFYYSFVRTYTFTNGVSNWIVTKIIKFYTKIFYRDQNKNFYKLPKKYSLYENEKNFILDTLRSEGYYISKKKLDLSLVDQILNYSKNIDGYFRDANNVPQRSRFNLLGSEPPAIFYYLEKDLVKNKLLTELLINHDFIDVAKNFLETTCPIISGLNMWWSFPSKKADTIGGQLFHFDLDRIKFLKIFIYITDVDTKNGPHCYVSGTNKNFSKKKFMPRGYKRIPDNEIKANFKEYRIKKICGDKGTVVFADTSCFHKGEPIIEKNRLILELEYSNSLFGGTNDTFELLKENQLDSSNVLLDLVREKNSLVRKFF